MPTITDLLSGGSNESLEWLNIRIQPSITGVQYKLYAFDPFLGPTTQPAFPANLTGTIAVLSEFVNYSCQVADLYSTIQKVITQAKQCATAPRLKLNWLTPAQPIATLLTLIPGGVYISVTWAFGSWSNAEIPLFAPFIVKTSTTTAVTELSLDPAEPNFLLKLLQALQIKANVGGAPVPFNVVLSAASNLESAFRTALNAAPKPLTTSGVNAIFTNPSFTAAQSAMAEAFDNAPYIATSFAYLAAALALKQLNKERFDASERAGDHGLRGIQYSRVMDGFAYQMRHQDGIAHKLATTALAKLPLATELLKRNPQVLSLYVAASIYNDMAERFGLPTLTELLELICTRGGITKKLQDCELSLCDKAAFLRADDISQEGVIYRSPYFLVEMTDLGTDGLYGETYVDALPYRIYLNTRTSGQRGLVSGVHEMLHGADEYLKLGLNHDQVHYLADFVVHQMLPAVPAIQAAYAK